MLKYKTQECQLSAGETKRDDGNLAVLPLVLEATYKGCAGKYRNLRDAAHNGSCVCVRIPHTWSLMTKDAVQEELLGKKANIDSSKIQRSDLLVTRVTCRERDRICGRIFVSTKPLALGQEYFQFIGFQPDQAWMMC